MNQYRIEIAPRGAECCVGSVPNSFRDYWINKPDGELESYLSSFPEENHSLPPVACLEKYWHDNDDIEHFCSPFYEMNSIVVYCGYSIFEGVHNCDELLDLPLDSPKIKKQFNDEWFSIIQSHKNKKDDTSILITCAVEKGSFEWEFQDDRPFDFERLILNVDCIDGDQYVTDIDYRDCDVQYTISDGSIGKGMYAWFVN